MRRFIIRKTIKEEKKSKQNVHDKEKGTEEAPELVELEHVPRRNKKVAGVMLDTTLAAAEDHKEIEDIHEVTISEDEFAHINIRTSHSIEQVSEEEIPAEKESSTEEAEPVKRTVSKAKERLTEKELDITKDVEKGSSDVGSAYVFPSINLLKRGTKKGTGDTEKQLKENGKETSNDIEEFWCECNGYGHQPGTDGNQI